jgi:hypothetical protein
VKECPSYTAYVEAYQEKGFSPDWRHCKRGRSNQRTANFVIEAPTSEVTLKEQRHSNNKTRKTKGTPMNLYRNRVMQSSSGHPSNTLESHQGNQFQGNPFQGNPFQGNPFQGNQMVGSLPFPHSSQILPQRLSHSFPSARNGSAPVETLNMLCDVVVAGNEKRMGGDFQKGERKRLKSLSEPSNVAGDNPVLMHRLNALGGGFPMPRWAQAATKGHNKQRNEDLRQQQRNLQIERINKMSGGFPMPRIADGKAVNVTPTSLNSYKAVWQQTHPEFQKEALSRRLERRDIKMMNRFNDKTAESD